MSRVDAPDRDDGDGAPDVYAFDVFTVPHERLKAGVLRGTWSRVLISAEYPFFEANELAAIMAVTIHGGVVANVLPRV